MKTSALILLFLLVGFQSLVLAAERHPTLGEGCGGDCRRIISLAPSVTEILFALHLGDRVVGVTRYCTYPAEALKKAKVGGYYDPNYEQILRLRPDLVIMLAEHDAAKRYLGNFHVRVLQVNHNTIGDIVQSIKIIGEACGAMRAADSMVASINGTMTRIQSRTAALARPRVMVSVGRAMGSSVSDLCIAGAGTYYDEMLRFAGGRNAFTKKGITFPMISLEGIYRINPAIVIDLVPESTGAHGATNVSDEAILAEWKKVGRIDAVRNGRVYLFRQEFAEIPGPRFILILEQMARAIHPELPWN